jgi:hypothetical protein
MGRETGRYHQPDDITGASKISFVTHLTGMADSTITTQGTVNLGGPYRGCVEAWG